MSIEKEFIKCEVNIEEDLTKNISDLIDILENSLANKKDYTFYYNYFYKRPNGTKVYLCKMDRKYRKNALDYFKKKQKEYKLNRKLSYSDANSLDDYECDYSRDVWLG